MKERCALVTGGTVRLGAAIAAELRSRGWRVLTVSHRPDAGADITADFTDAMGPAKAYAAALGLLGGRPPDALVNNAALFTGSAAELEAVNLSAPKKLTMLMAGRETEGRGAVVNILDAGDREGTYGETKRALREWTVTAAVMFAETLRVNAVSPGPVLAPVAVHEKAAETLTGRPTPEDVASAVAFLLENSSVTGHDLPVDGGARLNAL